MLQRGPRPTSHTSDRVPLWQTLRGRLITILFVALMPVLAFSLAEAAREIVNNRIASRIDLEHEAMVVDTEDKDLFDRAFQVMALLKRQPEIALSIDPACAKTLADALAAFTDFSNIEIADPAGKIICAAHPESPSFNVALFDWFTDLKTKKQPLIGGPIRRAAGSEPSLIIAEPLPFGPDAKTGAIFISIDHAFLNRLRRSNYVLRDTETFLLGANGRLLIGSGDSRSLPNAGDLASILNSPGHAYQASGLDGRRYLYDASPLHGGEVIALVVRGPMGFHLGRFFAASGQIALPVILTAIALVIVWFTADRIIVRWVRHLRAVAIAYRRGNMNVRTKNIEWAPRELAQLGQTLDQMASAIVDREARLVEHIEQREQLLREINHRVKNNLQIITSLLNLHVRSAKTEGERLLIRDIQARVDALALVYRSAYGAKNVVLIDLRELLPPLVDQIARYFQTDHQEIEVTTTCEEAHLTIDEAIPLAQLVTEAVSNSLRHAFPPHGMGRVEVTLKRETETTALLSVRDNGSGLPADLAQRPAPNRMGHSLIAAFAKQIGGTAEFKSEGGTEILVHFPYRQPPDGD